MFSEFSDISENPDNSSSDTKCQSMNLKIENIIVTDIRKSNHNFATSTPVSYGDKSASTNQDKMPKTPARVHFDSMSTGSHQSRCDMSSRDTLKVLTACYSKTLIFNSQC